MRPNTHVLRAVTRPLAGLAIGAPAAGNERGAVWIATGTLEGADA